MFFLKGMLVTSIPRWLGSYPLQEDSNWCLLSCSTFRFIGLLSSFFLKRFTNFLLKNFLDFFGVEMILIMLMPKYLGKSSVSRKGREGWALKWLKIGIRLQCFDTSETFFVKSGSFWVA
jgi:hypothetical protein